MAGRPLRRARRAARNPLVGWVNTSKYEVRDAFEPQAPLVKLGAEDSFRKAYDKVDLPLALYLYSEPPGGRSSVLAGAKALARQKNAIVLARAIQERQQSAIPFYRQAENLRGESSRTTPVTPFVALHNLAEDVLLIGIQSGLWFEEAAQLVAAFSEAEKAAKKAGVAKPRDAVASWGVNTWAGRAGVLEECDQAFADLFAKYLLTGRIDYDPQGTLTPSSAAAELNYQRTMKAFLNKMLPKMKEFLRSSCPCVIYTTSAGVTKMVPVKP